MQALPTSRKDSCQQTFHARLAPSTLLSFYMAVKAKRFHIAVETM